MKIAEKNNVVTFESLSAGDVLISPVSGSYCMKIEKIDAWESEISSEEINVIYLRDGVGGYITPAALVRKVDCELVIK